MPLPLDLILVRHGQSEGNVAIAKSHAGDNSLFTKEFSARHTATYRLTDVGISQAKAAGDWLKKNLKHPYFDRYLTSEYVRAMETAANLDLPDADWQIDFFLREREWGDLDGLNYAEQREKFSRNLEMKDSEPFFWTPPNGESFAAVCSNRISWVLSNLEKEYSDKRAIIVCHEEILWAFRIMIEKLRQSDFIELFNSTEPENKMVNCQIFHYTRKDPKTGLVLPYINWVRTVDPVNGEFETDWREIFPKMARFTNEELLEIAEKFERTIN